jgi:hypothetical protein
VSKGFITLGINTEADQLRYNYALALSIKTCDRNAEVCLVVDKGKIDDVPDKYFEAFDYIVELPFGNTGHGDGFHASNLWQMFHCTPFSETIYVDADVIFNKVDVDLLWSTCSGTGIAIPNSALLYDNTTHPTDSEYFEIETVYGLPAYYSSLIYFDKSSAIAKEWFKMLDPLMQNWRETYTELFKEKKPPTFSKHVLVNQASAMIDASTDLGIRLPCFYDFMSDSWTDTLDWWYTPLNQIIIENFIVSGIIHYRDRRFMNNDILDAIRNNYHRE